jgi:hypothetical protein
MPPMRRTWEHTQLRLTCDPGADGMPIYGWLAHPTDTKWQELGKIESVVPLINQLGAEGWEMVGSPVSQSAVFTYKAANETWHDRAYWVVRDFWFKREVVA